MGRSRGTGVRPETDCGVRLLRDDLCLEGADRIAACPAGLVSATPPMDDPRGRTPEVPGARLGPRAGAI